MNLIARKSLSFVYKRDRFQFESDFTIKETKHKQVLFQIGELVNTKNLFEAYQGCIDTAHKYLHKSHWIT